MAANTSDLRDAEVRDLERVAAEQAALRRVAELVARQAPSDEVFARVTEELSGLLDVNMVRTVRLEPDGSATVVAVHGIPDDRLARGAKFPIPAGSLIEMVSRTGDPSRLDDFSDVRGPIGDILRDQGARAGAGGPIVVDGRLWGVMAVFSRQPLPVGTEDRVAQFAELVSTAISNIESRERVERLGAEQAALRRVAELVARQAPPDDVFALVTEELGRLLEVNMVRTVRFEPDGIATVVAAHGITDDRLTRGASFPIPEGSVIEKVFRTGQPARVDNFEEVKGRVGAVLREQGAGAGVGGPIVVDGRLWGAMAVGARSAEVLPPGCEERVAQFAELVSTAISNVESRARVEQLAAEQAALRRVAELVARQAPPEDVFGLVTEELNRLLDVSNVGTARFEPDGTATVMAVRGTAKDAFPAGKSVRLEGGSMLERVFRTGRPVHTATYENVGNPMGPIMRELGAGWAAAGPIVVDERLWGAMVVNSSADKTYPPGAEERVAQFAELVSTAISNIEARAKVERLAAEQSALRRVAMLVARAPASEQLFSTVAREVASVLDVSGVIVTRYDADGMAITLGEAFRSDLAGAEEFLGIGTRMPRDPGSLAAQVFDTHGPARVDDFSTLPGTVGELARAAQLGSGCAGPIVVNGSVWGKMCVFSRVGTVLPAGMENRLRDFIELVATAIANYESRANIERLAAEQSALRRVATLVARQHSPDDLFLTLAEEVRVLLGVDASEILRYETDGTATMVAGWSDSAISLPLGERLPLDGGNLASEVLRTGLPGRREDYSDATGEIAALSREVGIRSAVACPILVDGTTWGMIAVASRRPEPLPSGTEERLAEFSRHAAMAVANAKSRSDLAESRARIVRAGDEARRRFERNLHDGAQQRLVSLGLELRAAEATVPAGLGDLRPRLARTVAGLNDVLDDLRELSRGLHPAVLSEGGLTPALSSLALRSTVPVDLRIDLGAERFEEPIEVAAYYVASEALTNAAKHAGASCVEMQAARSDGSLELVVSDDGRGGAVASSGSGLTGLIDRVEAIGGAIHIDSRPGMGTAIRVKLPLESGRPGGILTGGVEHAVRTHHARLT